jgi:signal transduction histidine kinase
MNIWYLEILDNVRMGVFVFDSEHQLKKVNITGLEILDTFVPELLENSSLSRMPIQSVFPDSVFRSWVRRFITSDITGHNQLMENMVARKNDRECIYNVRVSKIIYDSNYKFDLVVTLDDITAQKENEHRLFELEKFADMGQMASSISHELNNYLALILGGVELTQMALSRDNLEKAGATLEKLKSNIDKMKRYTSGLMDYSRLNTKKEKTNLSELVRDVLSFVMVQKKFKTVALHTELAPDFPAFVMDKDQIAQLLLNFLNNAVDAISEAGTKTGQIWVKTDFKNNLASLSVADNGIGIKPEVKERLFRAHLTTKKKGHGYGLMTCAKIIENHGGRIEIESEFGAGSMFTIFLPINPEVNVGEGQSGHE